MSRWATRQEVQAELRQALERIVGHIDNGPANLGWIRAVAAGALLKSDSDNATTEPK